jgi:hypothetical protein
MNENNIGEPSGGTERNERRVLNESKRLKERSMNLKEEMNENNIGKLGWGHEIIKRRILNGLKRWKGK